MRRWLPHTLAGKFLVLQLGVVALVLMLRHVRGGPEPDDSADDDAPRVRVPELTY